MNLFKLAKNQKNIVIALIVLTISLITIIWVNNNQNDIATEETLPYQREFEKTFSLKEKFELSKEYFHYNNADYLTYFSDIEWDEKTDFIKMPTDLTLIEHTTSKIVFENQTSFLEEELELFKLFYELEEEVLRQEHLTENGQEFYDFTLYDEITLKLNEQAKLVDELKQKEAESERIDAENKEYNSHLLLALHLLTSEADNFEVFIHEYHQWQDFLVGYLETIELYTQIALTETKVDADPLQSLKEQTEEEINNMYIFYKDPTTFEIVLLGKLDVETTFNSETNTLTTQIIFHYNQGLNNSLEKSKHF